MGYSTPYTLFSGAGEVLGGLLLFFRRTTTLDEEAARIQSLIRPLARLAGAIGEDVWRPEMVADWWTTASVPDEEEPVSPDVVRARANLLYHVLEGLGDIVPEAQWGF